MNKKINEDLKSLKFIFSKNKPYIIPVIVILISIILFFQLVIPQFNALLTARKEDKELSLKLEVLKENLNILANIDDQVLSSQLETLKLALPLNKDFVGILNSINSASQKTGVSIGSFSFKVGDLSEFGDDNNLPVVSLSLPVNASIVGVNSFVEAIAKTIPLSEVHSIKTGDMFSTVNLSFYYKPLGASNYSQDARINPVSQKGLTLINQLNEFENAFSFSEPLLPVSTSSATQ